MPASLYFEQVHRTGEQLVERGDCLAGGWRSLGLAEGDVVAVLMRNDAVFGDIVHASRRSGCYYCPINWHATPQEISFVLRDCGARVLIAHADLLAACTAVIPGGMTVLVLGDDPAGEIAYEEWLAMQPPYDGPVVAPRGHMAYASAHTGAPKGVARGVLPLDQLDDQAARQQVVVRATLGIVPGCRALMPAPLFISGPTVFMQNALVLGERLVVTDKFDAEQVLALIEQHRIETVYLVPMMASRMLKLPVEVRARYDLTSLRFVASTGAAYSPGIKRAMIGWLGPIVHETYASSESGMVTAIDSSEAMTHPGSVGRPVGDAAVRILDHDGRACAAGEVGLIYVRQPAYADFTYRGNDAARRAIERDGFITVGDMGAVDADGFLYVGDRATDMVVTRGVRVYPMEIEQELMRFVGMADCAVFGVPDDEWGERVVAVVQPEPGVPLDLDAVVASLRERLPEVKQPSAIEVMDELPRDDIGNIARHRLRTQWTQRAQRMRQP